MTENGADARAAARRRRRRRDRHRRRRASPTCRAACRASGSTRRHFLDEVVAHGTEGCNYLLAVDVEMNTVDGYAMSSWSRGYGDFAMIPDFATLRRVPWQPGTALRAGRPGAGSTAPPPVLASPRQILQRQLDRLAEAGLPRLRRHRARVRRSTATPTRTRTQAGYRGPDPGQRLQRRLLAAADRPGRAAAAPASATTWPAPG